MMKEAFPKSAYDIIIVGGGLAGLTASILLSKNNYNVLVIEKNKYPFHKVCGEYVSNEVLEFFESIGLFPFKLGASKISRLRISDPSGKSIFAPLDLGGFGISRYRLDEAMQQLAIKNNVQILDNTKVIDVDFSEDHFFLKTNRQENFSSKLIIGGYGKRDSLDKILQRNFIQSHTRYMAVKYHVKTDYPVDEIGLDNFNGGYCGISKIEDDLYNICYLYRRNNNFRFTSMQELEEKVLFKNPLIKKIFSKSQFIFEEPKVINEISFTKKSTVENHVLMCGDAAGLITPLCGNGMAMSIHAAKLLSEEILHSGILHTKQITANQRTVLEDNYTKKWNMHFKKRLMLGRAIQSVFGNPMLTQISLRMIHSVASLERWLIRGTHGKSIGVFEKTV
jgi:flavin-dependent dehydrogenase